MTAHPNGHFKGKKARSKEFRTATTYKYEPQNTGMSFSYEISALDNLKTQNVIHWHQIIKSLSITCNWTENQLFTVLKGTISPLILSSMPAADFSDKVYKNILAKVYDASNLNSLYEELKRTVQMDLTLIGDYYQEVTRINQELSYTSGLYESETLQRAHEVF